MDRKGKETKGKRKGAVREKAGKEINGRKLEGQTEKRIFFKLPIKWTRETKRDVGMTKGGLGNIPV